VNPVEAGICYFHMAALVSQCLRTMQAKKKDLDLRAIPDGAKAFKQISSNLSEEEASSTEGEGIGESSSFSEAGLALLLKRGIEQVMKEKYFETAYDAYKLLLPIYEKNRDYESQRHAHDIIGKFCNSLNEMVRTEPCCRLETIANSFLLFFFFSKKTSGKRLLSSYFRVAFFGSAFKTVNGVEFVYKEKPATPLSEISNKLETFYATKFGADTVKLIHESGAVDTTKLNPNIVSPLPPFSRLSDCSQPVHFLGLYSNHFL